MVGVNEVAITSEVCVWVGGAGVFERVTVVVRGNSSARLGAAALQLSPLACPPAIGPCHHHHQQQRPTCRAAGGALWRREAERAGAGAEQVWAG